MHDNLVQPLVLRGPDKYYCLFIGFIPYCIASSLFSWYALYC